MVIKVAIQICDRSILNLLYNPKSLISGRLSAIYHNFIKLMMSTFAIMSLTQLPQVRTIIEEWTQYSQYPATLEDGLSR